MIIFIDIDGVIKDPKNHDNWYSDSIGLINKLCADTDAKLVIASNWKLLKPLSFFNKIFNGNVVGVTPDINQGGDYHKEPEVLSYVRQHNVEAWIAIDDKDYEYPKTQKRLVLTSEGKFTETEYQQCINLLCVS